MLDHLSGGGRLDSRAETYGLLGDDAGVGRSLHRLLLGRSVDLRHDDSSMGGSSSEWKVVGRWMNGVQTRLLKTWNRREAPFYTIFLAWVLTDGDVPGAARYRK